MTVAERIAWAADLLRHAGVPADEAPGDAEVLARHLLGWSVATLVAERRQPLPAGFDDRYIPLIERRCRREPVSQIVGCREFWGLDFEVTRDVLTPRPETEGIIAAALELLSRDQPLVILDVGTGSGCLAIALATELPNARFVASDVSLAALTVARRNAARHGVANRIAFLHSDLLVPEIDVDVIVSNPPYIALQDAETLPVEVRVYEPHVALFGGEDGLDIYRRLLPQSRNSIAAADGWLILEVGYDQADAVTGIARKADWEVVTVRHDLQGIPRTLVLKPRARSPEPV